MALVMLINERLKPTECQRNILLLEAMILSTQVMNLNSIQSDNGLLVSGTFVVTSTWYLSVTRQQNKDDKILARVIKRGSKFC